MFLSNQLHLQRYMHNSSSNEACEAACIKKMLACLLACLLLLFCSVNKRQLSLKSLASKQGRGHLCRPFVLHACPCQDCSIKICIVCTVCTPSCDSMKVTVISEQLPVRQYISGQMETQPDAGNWTRLFCRAENAFRACTHTHYQMTRTTLCISQPIDGRSPTFIAEVPVIRCRHTQCVQS